MSHQSTVSFIWKDRQPQVLTCAFPTHEHVRKVVVYHITRNEIWYLPWSFALFSYRPFYSGPSPWVSAAGPHPVEAIRWQQGQEGGDSSVNHARKISRGQVHLKSSGGSCGGWSGFSCETMNVSLPYFFPQTQILTANTFWSLHCVHLSTAASLGRRLCWGSSVSS